MSTIPFGRDGAARNLAALVSAIAEVGEFGPGQQQSGSNGPEILFRCPLCSAAGHDSKARNMRVTRRLDGDDVPYVGCRQHDSAEDWGKLRRALVSAGVPERLLSAASGRLSAGKAVSSRARFPDRPDGLGETDPVPFEALDEWCERLSSRAGVRYRRYLQQRGLSADTIAEAQLGLGAFVWAKGKRPVPRITIPVFDAAGRCVNVQLARVGGGTGPKRLALPHPELLRVVDGEVTDKYQGYGAPARFYGLDLLAADSADEGEDAVWIVGGEWDRLLAVQNGLLAISPTSGEGTLPRRADAEYLEGRDVVIVMDCDEAGRRATAKFALACAEIGAADVQIVDLAPERADGYDLADWFADGGNAAALAKLAEPWDSDLAAESATSGSTIELADFSDHGIAAAVAARERAVLRYVTESGSWISWVASEGVWEKYPVNDAIAPTNAVREFAAEARDALKSRDDEYAEEAAKFLQNYKNTSRNGAAVRMLSNLWDMRVSLREIDARPDLLNVANGTLNLSTFDLVPAAPDDLLTKATRGAVLEEGDDGAGSVALWDKILRRSVPDLETRTALQHMTGVSLLDGNPLQAMVFLVGGTGTGKSVFQELLAYALGSYAGSFNLSMFRDNQDEKPRADLVRALTQRAIFASEASEQWRLHVDQIKRLTGEDSITARMPHSGEYVERIPAFTPWFRTNQPPHIETPDLALYRRLIVFPFDRPYLDAEGKGRELAAGKSGGFVQRYRDVVKDAVVTWAVEGLMEWSAAGGGEIEKSKEMLLAEAAFREALNDTQVFLAEETEPDGAGRVSFKELYDRYVDWAFNAGISGRDVLSKKSLGDRLSGLGYGIRKSNSVTYRTGLNFRSGTRTVQ